MQNERKASFAGPARRRELAESRVADLTGEPKDLNVRLESLAAFLPAFRTTDFDFYLDDGSTDGYSETAVAFFKAINDNDFHRAFDYLSWSDTAEFEALVNDASVLSQASPEDLAKLLTTFMRLERFGVRMMANWLETGLMTRILERAEDLARDPTVNEARWTTESAQQLFRSSSPHGDD
jgi:hypothetical protein